MQHKGGQKSKPAAPTQLPEKLNLTAAREYLPHNGALYHDNNEQRARIYVTQKRSSTSVPVKPGQTVSSDSLKYLLQWGCTAHLAANPTEVCPYKL